MRRHPVRGLWLRDGPAVHLDCKGLAIALALAIVPVVLLVQAVAAREWIAGGWLLAAIVGTVPAAYVTRGLRREQGGEALRWIAISTVIGVAALGAMVLPAVLASGRPLNPLSMLAAAAETLLLYIPVQFVLEEVSFRGALDTHVQPASRRRAWLSALAVSLLWGLWHLPIAGSGAPLGPTIAQLLVVHGLVGVPLSLGWRRTGNLMIPVVAHALIDAVRNALLTGLA